MRLHHVNVLVPVGTTASVVGFYELLGLTPAAKPGERAGAWFDLPDGTQVHVSERDGPRHPDSHFALVSDDLDALAARLGSAGHPWSDGPGLDGARRGTTRDPQGNLVEVLEPRGPFA
ncbi:MAG: glyoxalase [Frankiales bacterium]|nr:glyoxalase [Frankiales bacterium]